MPADSLPENTAAPNEEKLIEAAQRGSLGAFNDLVRFYEQRVYNLCYRMLGNPDDAADVTQSAFISAYQAIGRFRGGSFKAWLLRLATNACYDQLRLRQRRPTQSLNILLDDEEQPLDIPDTDRSGAPEGMALQAELGQYLQQALAKLPDEQRMAVILADVEGMSYDEIAVVTQTSLGTVKSRISRARLKLRDIMLKNRELLPTQYRHIGEG